MARFWRFLLCVFFPLSIASAQSFEEEGRQRMAAASLHIRETAQAERATVVRDSLRMTVFGAGAAVGFYTLEEAGGKRQQRMFVVETQTDKSRGEAGPPIPGPHITLKRYYTRQVVVGDVRVGSGGRTLDVAQAKIRDERTMGFHLDATVTVPIAGTNRTATFKISHPLRTEKATITEAGQ